MALPFAENLAAIEAEAAKAERERLAAAVLQTEHDYSRIECSRCGETLSVGYTPEMQIARLIELLDECRSPTTETGEAEG